MGGGHERVGGGGVTDVAAQGREGLAVDLLGDGVGGVDGFDLQVPGPPAQLDVLAAEGPIGGEAHIEPAQTVEGLP